MSEVARRLGIRFEHHDAGEDAYACAEIALAAITSRSSRDMWQWLKWLPHTSSPHSPLPGDHLAVVDEPAVGIVGKHMNEWMGV